MNDTPLQRESVEESIGGGDDFGLPDRREVLAGIVAALGQGRVLAHAGAGLGKELAKIALGKSEVRPAKGDRRFGDPAWSSNPSYRRIMQFYLASTGVLDRIIDDWSRTASDPSRAQAASFAATILASAVAPTNYLPTNPAALKELFDTGGHSLVRGIGNYLSDLRTNGGMPSMVEPEAFEVGVDLAITPGAVVSRDDVAEVLQYSPAGSSVYERPVLVVPPPIGRFYFLDLRPGRSFVEHSVARGMQTFLMSWRNPQPEQGDWTLDTYAARVSSALDEVRDITGSADVNVIGFCAGGLITTTLLNHMTAQGDTRVHSMSYAVTMLDFEKHEKLAAFSSPRLLSFAGRRSRRKGIISGRDMASAFTWMRPDDLVFNYVVNNYLMGRKPPAFDILAWNADSTNLPGALHVQFLDIFANNLLVKRGAMEVLGTPVELDRIDVPTFVTAAISDHLTAWTNCYRTTQLISGDSTFVLSYSGHIASLINPPGNPKAHYWVGDAPGPDPQDWLAGAERTTGSWWEPWADWVSQRAGGKVEAPPTLGSDQHKPLGPAPGMYVRDMIPE
ncbi:alpha/beta fold hydrolase [Rhodococcus sp. T2V]|uniref:PHA/PHB synthase family protein n=1 Tax=Rhodococcus sp. T2V TaxID=3034164 RepID=UPI0023E0AD92|nr:alpha/beta fold hydrolase [Rhodococcus sp. T2V]MDF3312162.1 alpha/beta fold hydrolase [Rhodococcus sp. T2V]